MQYIPASSPETAYLDTLRSTIFSWKRPRRSARILLRRRLVVRDVLTCLAVESVWAHWHPHILIVLRHPCAVASSWARLDFQVDYRLKILLAQPRLLEDHLAPFASHLQQPGDFYFQLGAYWGATYYILERLSRPARDWQWISHETLCVELQGGYSRILNGFGLEMRDEGKRFLKQTNRAPRSGDSPFAIARESAKEPDKWKDLLTPTQISAVMAGVAPFGVFENYYPHEN